MKVYWCFGGTCFHHLQGWRMSWAGHQHESRWQVELLKYHFNRLHGVMSQKIELFITAALRSSPFSILLYDVVMLHSYKGLGSLNWFTFCTYLIMWAWYFLKKLCDCAIHCSCILTLQFWKMLETFLEVKNVTRIK
jgi:hypothetical protein